MSNKSSNKKSNSNIELKHHQIMPVEHMKKNRGLILYHGTGSGKTITALSAMYQFKENIVIIGPKSSKKAFNDDIKKMELDAQKIKFYTFAKIKKIIKNSDMDILTGMSVIVDEAHNMRNETSDNMLLMTAIEFATRVMLLTATPVINYLNDLAVLINIVQNKAVLPTDVRSFNASYYNEELGEIINKKTLKEKINNCISYYSRGNENIDYPDSDVIYKETEMNDRQIEEYRFYIRKFLYDQIVGSNSLTIDFENINERKKNFFLSSTRQLSNTIDGESDFPKILSMYETIINGKFPCVVYSNYLKNGVFALTPMLERDNISYKTITGNTNDEKINHIVNGYNKGKYKVLLITSAGSESLDLKNTRQIHIMEPHWNESRIKQVIGRVIRYKSHSDLPAKERHVTIYRWVSVFPKGVHNKSADQYLVELSKKKDNIFKLFNQIIKDVSIENKEVMHGGKHRKMVGDFNKLYLANKYIYTKML